MPLQSLVYVVEDDEDIRKFITETLTSVDYEVQAFSDGHTALVAVRERRPDCMVVDMLLPRMTGLKLCQDLAAAKGETPRFVMISGHGDVPSAVEAMRLGAVDFLEKPFGRERLVAAVQQALKLSAERAQDIAEKRKALELLDSLTPREREVFDLVASGRVTKQIATLLKISPRTVDVHRANIARKLKLESPTQLAHFISVCLRDAPAE